MDTADVVMWSFYVLLGAAGATTGLATWRDHLVAQRRRAREMAQVRRMVEARLADLPKGDIDLGSVDRAEGRKVRHLRVVP